MATSEQARQHEELGNLWLMGNRLANQELHRANPYHQGWTAGMNDGTTEVLVDDIQAGIEFADNVGLETEDRDAFIFGVVLGAFAKRYLMKDGE